MDAVQTLDRLSRYVQLENASVEAKSADSPETTRLREKMAHSSKEVSALAPAILWLSRLVDRIEQDGNPFEEEKPSNENTR